MGTVKTGPVTPDSQGRESVRPHLGRLASGAGFLVWVGQYQVVRRERFVSDSFALLSFIIHFSFFSVNTGLAVVCVTF